MAAGTWPCRADSGLSPGPHTAFGTGAKNNSWSAMLGCFFSAALSAPPIDDSATHDSAIASVRACLTYLFRLLIRSILLDLRKVRCLLPCVMPRSTRSYSAGPAADKPRHKNRYVECVVRYLTLGRRKNRPLRSLDTSHER